MFPSTDKEVRISITVGTIVKSVVVLFSAWLLYYLQDLVYILIASVVIASAIEPGTLWLERRGFHRTLAVVFLYLGAFLLLFGLIYLLLPPLLDDLIHLTAQLPDYLESLDGLSYSTLDLVENVGQFVELILPETGRVLTTAGGGFLQTVSFVFGGIFSFVLIAVLSFYFAVQENGIEEFLRVVSPAQYEEYLIGLWQRSRKKIGYWMQGQLLLGVIMGVLVYLGLSVVGLRFALLLAIFAAVFEIIPVFGPILAAVPAVAVGLGDDLSTGLVVLGMYIIFQQFENHLIYPLVVRKLVGVPPLLVIVSLIVGGRIAGFLGILLAVPVSAAFVEFLNDYEKSKIALRARSNPSV